MRALKNLAKRLPRLIQDDDGPSAVEYAILLALIVVVSVAAIRSVGESVHGIWAVIDGAVGGSSE